MKMNLQKDEILLQKVYCNNLFRSAYNDTCLCHYNTNFDRGFSNIQAELHIVRSENRIESTNDIISGRLRQILSKTALN